MSLAGVINSHLIMAYIIANHGTEEQKQRFLPAMAAGEKRGGLALTEPHAGSDVQSIRRLPRATATTTSCPATRCSSPTLATARCSPSPPRPIPRREPAYAGISMFAVEKERSRPDRQPPTQEAWLQGYRYLRSAIRGSRGAGRQPYRRARGPGLQAGDERAGSRPDQRRGARGRGRAGGL